MSIFAKPDFLLPFGVYTNISPAVGAANMYAATIDRPLSLIQWVQSFFVNGTNNTTNYWSIALIALSSPSVTLATLFTNLSSGLTWQQASAINFAVNPVLPTTHFTLLVQVGIAAGAPGNVFLPGPALKVIG